MLRLSDIVNADMNEFLYNHKDIIMSESFIENKLTIIVEDIKIVDLEELGDVCDNMSSRYDIVNNTILIYK